MVAEAYRRSLLATFAPSVTSAGAGARARVDALEWAASGAMELTGFSDGPPLLSPGPLASAARGAMAALVTLARELPHARTRDLESIDGPALLGERAAIAKLARRGTTSPGGSCHLLRCADGWLAVNLARPDDLSLVPAWLEEPSIESASAPSARDAIAHTVRTRDVGSLVERGILLGLPVAEAAERVPRLDVPMRVAARGGPCSRSFEIAPLVVDLSALWAGPLCGHLLELAGARVLKVESTRRPDGARRGPSEFYDLLNAGKESIALDFESNDGRRALSALLARADIVIEGSRPRALAALGIDAGGLVEQRPGLVWVSISGYGRREPDADRVAFGDDAGAAAGLSMALASSAGGSGVPVFCGDAIADPLAGLHAAVAALALWRRGDSALVAVALRDVAAYAAGFSAPWSDRPISARVRYRSESPRDEHAFEVLAGDERELVRPPRARRPARRASSLGADTTRALAEPRGNRC